MELKTSLLALGIVVLVAAGSVSGYASTGSGPFHAQSDETPSDETIEDHALSNNTTIDSVTGTVVIESDLGETNRTMTADIWQKPPDKVRYEYTDGPTEGDVLVSNGSTFWSYNESQNTARRLQLSELNSESFQNLQKAFQNLSDQFNADYKGEATVSGRETYAVSVQPGNGTFGETISNQTVWLDQENWFPVKQETTVSVGNDTGTTSVTYSDLSYNESIPDDKFTFEPPEDAKVIDTELPTPKSFSSIENAESAVNFSIKEPDSLDGSVNNVSVTSTNNQTAVSVMYQDDSDVRMFHQSTAETPINGEDVSIDGLKNGNASYQSIGDQGILQWNDGEFSYSISGDLSKSSLVDVAESMYC